ncbi:foldase [Sorangium cellulosum]|uniref:Periplasmic chaperone PpiD n=1 Tax=Sorangium cellulosum TaxID=56 RepID=A0A4P2PZV5_SORCE|nr:peptidylprolyl isomerase [Sorangium cellulosum]AUX22178.1 foldase [Sorangium cellulosum]
MNRLSQIFGAAVVIAIAVVFIVQFRPATGPVQSSGSTCAVEVSGSCISSIEFNASRNLLSMRSVDENRLRAMGLRRLTAEGLYERWLLNEDAERLGISVSDDELTAELVAGRMRVSLPADKIRQIGYALNLPENLIRYLDVRNRQTKKFDTKQYERQVRNITKMSPTDFREYQKKELLAARMRDLIRARVRVGENEAFEQFSREKSTRALSYVRFDRRFYTDLVVDTSDKAVQAWADANKEELDKAWEGRKAQYQPECRVVRDILVEVDPASGDGPEAAKAAAKERIEKAAERLKKGERFADVARSASDDPSAARGGDLGCVTKGRLTKPVEDELLAMKPGEVSDIIETESGFHVVKLEQIARDAEAEKIGRHETARELYVAHESERLAAEAAKQVLAAAAGGKSLEDALGAYLDQLAPAKGNATAAPGARADGGKGDGAKGAGQPEPGEARPPYTLANHPNRPAIETSLPFNVSGSPIADAKDSTEPARLAFQLDKPGDLPKDVVALENGYAVIQLKEKTSPSQEQWEKDREFYTSAMRAAKQNDALVGYIRRLKSTIGSEVKYDQNLLKEIRQSEDGQTGAPLDEGE